MNTPSTLVNCDKEKLRFYRELAFVESLSNVEYLHTLATTGFFDKPENLTYLKGLTYWLKLPYSKYISYPLANYHLTLLIEEDKFSEVLKDKHAVHAFVLLRDWERVFSVKQNLK